MDKTTADGMAHTLTALNGKRWTAQYRTSDGYDVDQQQATPLAYHPAREPGAVEEAWCRRVPDLPFAVRVDPATGWPIGIECEGALVLEIPETKKRGTGVRLDLLVDILNSATDQGSIDALLYYVSAAEASSPVIASEYEGQKHERYSDQ